MAVIVLRHEFEGDDNFNNLSLWIIPVTLINHQKRFNCNFLLDTGAQRTLIIPYVQEVLNISETNQFQRGIGVSGTSNYKIGEIDNLEIGSITLGSLQILIGELPQFFSKYKILGLLGADILKTLYITLDYPRQLLVIEKTIVLP